MKNLSLYWKCQLIGWSAFTVAVIGFNALVYRDGSIFLPFAVSILIFGLLLSHAMKQVIRSLRILKKKFAAQVWRLGILSILFSALSTFLWMLIMMELGIWEIDPKPDHTWSEQFYKEYFFNLFPVILTFSGWLLIYFLFHYVKGVRKQERLRIHYKLQTAGLEAKALRSQMTPHFIFNCLNSIKSLIQEDEKEKSVSYLTTFSKLIRTLFNNADKKEITLYDEIETCRLYLQLEAMRFDTKFSYSVHLDESIDLKSVFVPALIVQPFIENAIWHGIVPKEAGGNVLLSVTKSNSAIEISVDDDGIGREASQLNKAKTNIGHQSKGVALTQSRLELDNLLKQRKAGLKMIDKTDTTGHATGTRVIIHLPQEDQY